MLLFGLLCVCIWLGSFGMAVIFGVERWVTAFLRWRLRRKPIDAMPPARIEDGSAFGAPPMELVPGPSIARPAIGGALLMLLATGILCGPVWAWHAFWSAFLVR